MSDLAGELFAVAQRLQQQGEPYALVSVVRTQAPSSARAGDKALVTSQGIVHGRIGSMNSSIVPPESQLIPNSRVSPGATTSAWAAEANIPKARVSIEK